MSAEKGFDDLYRRVYTNVQTLDGGRPMRTVTFTEFRRKASQLLSDVEQGQTIVVLRYGKPIAEISPPQGGQPDQPSWKRPGLRLVSRGASLSAAILEERET